MFQTGSRSYPERLLLGKIWGLSVPGRLRARAIREQLIVLQVACKWHKTFVAGMGKFLFAELSAQLPFFELARQCTTILRHRFAKEGLPRDARCALRVCIASSRLLPRATVCVWRGMPKTTRFAWFWAAGMPKTTFFCVVLGSWDAENHATYLRGC